MTASNSPSIRPAKRAAVLRPIYAAYGLWAWAVFAVFVPFAILGAICMPTLPQRRGAARLIARSYLSVTGMSLRVQGLERLPAMQCVVVANHASYLDGIVMVAVLPARFAYVVKREMDRVPLAGLLLRRLGTEFVERFNRHKGATDARRVLRKASGGQSMVFFPEGTFATEPGVLKFHNGAFATAARAGCPVVPVAVRGTRDILPGSRMLPWPGRIDVVFLDVLAPIADADDATERAAIALRDQARQAIVAACGEADALQAPDA